MKALIIGHARHGKDTFAEMTGLTFKSSSEACLEIFLYDEINKYRSDNGIDEYSSLSEAYNDRVNYRDFWYQSIRRYNSKDNSRLAKEIMKNNDVYVGMRSEKEYKACMHIGLFDKVFWVEAGLRKPKESKKSMTIQYDPKEMIIIDNTKDLKNLRNQAKYHFPTSFSS